MSQLPGTFNFGDYVSGDTVPAVPMTFPSDMDFTGSTALLQFRRAPGETEVLALTDTSGISIATNVVTIEKFTAPTVNEKTIYFYDLQITTSGGDVRTWSHGSITIWPDISR